MQALNPYQARKKQTQDKIDQAMKDFAEAKKNLIAAMDEVLDQETKEKKKPKEYNATKHKKAKKNEILYTGDVKRYDRELKLLQAQLQDFADGFENFEKQRQQDAKNVEDHAKMVFFEVEKYNEKLGDTTKKLKAAYEQCRKLYDESHAALKAAKTEQDEFAKTITEGKKSQGELDEAEAEYPKAKEKCDKLITVLLVLKKKVAVLEERYNYYEGEKAKFKQMLADKKIDDKEYKYYKEALKRELK